MIVLMVHMISLISMPIYNLTKEKVDDLLKEKENLETELRL